MPIWDDIRKQSAGIVVRVEDQRTRFDILLDNLKNMVVCPTGFPPVKFLILTMQDKKTQEVKIFSLASTCIEHPDGTRDYYSEENINRIKNAVGDDWELLNLE